MGSDLKLSVKMNENFHTGLSARGGINRIKLNTVYPSRGLHVSGVRASLYK
jgi:hypothetical protein